MTLSGLTRRMSRSLLRYYAALRLAAGSMLDIVPDGAVADAPPIVRRSENELPSGFDRRELIQVGGITHVVTLRTGSERHARGMSLN
jgi:hypothetical protein